MVVSTVVSREQVESVKDVDAGTSKRYLKLM
jgi:hypothetical protein